MLLPVNINMPKKCVYRSTMYCGPTPTPTSQRGYAPDPDPGGSSSGLDRDWHPPDMGSVWLTQMIPIESKGSCIVCTQAQMSL